jgi:hypothetical protein
MSLYRVQGGATTTLSTTISSTTTSYSDSGLTASTTYSYFLTATNAIGTSSNGAVAATSTLSYTVFSPLNSNIYYSPYN